MTKRDISVGADEIVAFVLSVILSVTAMSLYGDGFIKIILICLGLNLLSFAVCHFVNLFRFFGTFGIIFYMAAYLMILMRCVVAGEVETGVYFWQWMVSGGDISTLEIAYGSDVLFKTAMYMAASLFFSVCIFYFSVPTYRFGYLTLISLMPFVLYAKVTEEVENRYLVIVVLASILLHFICSRKVTPTRAEYKQAKKESRLLSHVDPVHSKDWQIGVNGVSMFFIGLAILTIVVLIGSAAFPKRKEARFYDKFEDLFLGGDTDSEIDESFSGLADFSGNADNFREGSNRRLYMVMGDGQVYLKRAVFDVYDFKKNRWYNSDSTQISVDPESWISEQRLLSLTNLSKALIGVEELEPGFLDRYDMGTLMDAAPISDPTFHYSISAQNFEARYYLSGARISNISMPSSEDYSATDKGTFYRNEGMHSSDITYSIDMYGSYEGIRQLTDCGGVLISAQDSLQMFREAEKLLTDEAKRLQDTGISFDDYINAESKTDGKEENPDEEAAKRYGDLVHYIRIISAFKNDLIKAMTYQANMKEEQGKVPEDIHELALEITDGMEYDCYKASAIMAYFENNDFLYDLRYRAPDDSPSYFLFEGKTGTCSDYASAFVLLAREAGLMARYTEGFVPEQTYGNMYQTVTESDSHAYAEVYIENIGWIVFDPTSVVPNADSGDFFDFLKSLHIDYGLLQVLGIAASFIAFVILMIKLIIPLAAEGIFRLRLVFGKPENMLVPAYRRLLGKLRKSGQGIPELTPGEFADFVLMQGYDITGFITLIEQTGYAGKEVFGASTDKKAAKQLIVKSYSAALSAISKSRKKKL